MKIRSAKTLFLLCGILLSPIVVAMTQPNNMSETTKLYGVQKYNLYTFFNTKVRAPSVVEDPARVVILALTVVGSYIYYRSLKHRQIKNLTFVVIAFSLIVIYNPLSYIFLSLHLPHWAINRLLIINQLGVVFMVILYFFITEKLTLHLRPGGKLLLFITLVLLLFLPSKVNIGDYKKQHALNNSLEETILIYESLDVVDPDEVILARLDRSIMLPAAFATQVVAINELHSAPSADIENRLSCYSRLISTMDQELLFSAGIDYVYVWIDDIELMSLAESSSNLSHVDSLEVEWVKAFKVNKSTLDRGNSTLCRYNE